MKTFKIALNLLVLTFIVVIFSSCGNSYETLSPEVLKSNEEIILNSVYWDFSETKEYKNGQKMQPPMIFDKVYAVVLNMNSSNIDMPTIEGKEHEIEFKWDDWNMDEGDLEDMIEANTPIVELNMHWVDPMSANGSNGWKTYTYFFPQAELEDGVLKLGRQYRIGERLSGVNYFPYFMENPLDAPMSGGSWMNLKDPAIIEQKIMYNGEVKTIKQFLSK